MLSWTGFINYWQELKAKNSLKLHLFLIGIIIASFTVSFFQIKSLTQLKSEAQDTQNVASLKEARFISNEILIKVKKEVKNKVKENHEDTGLESLSKIFKEHKAKKFERVAKEGKNSKKDSEIFSWYKVSFEGKGETIQGSFDKKTKNLNLKNPSKELSQLYDKILRDPNVEDLEPNYIVSLEQTTDPRVTVIQPNGGEVWQTGVTYTIQWTVENIPNQNPTSISLHTLDGNILRERLRITDTAQSIIGTNSFTWTILSTLNGANNYTINIEVKYQRPDGGWSQYSDLSDQVFTISAPSTPTPSPTDSPTLTPTAPPDATPTATASPTPTYPPNVPNDPYYHTSGSWGQTYSDLWGVKKVNLEDAWFKIKGSANIIVADIDTGVDRNHEDLKDNMWVNSNETQSNGIDDDGNGFIDDYYGWDFANNDNDPMDDHGHGTHTAGTIAAVGNNGIGVVGINWISKILPVKFLSSGGSGTSDNGARALIYAADMGAKVSSNSWGCSCQSTIVDDAINYEHSKGMLIAVAAGNNNGDALDFSPASSERAITVAASDSNDLKASFSNLGEKIDVIAPGVDILSTKSSLDTLCSSRGSTVGVNYCRLSGTSMAAPHAAGLSALILSNNPNLSNEEVRQIMRSYAKDLGDAGKDPYYGYGLIEGSTSVLSSSAISPFISFPANRGTLKGNVSINGSAAGQNFSSYKLEVGAGRSPSSWTEIATSNTSIANGVLGTLNTTSFADGGYTIKLSAFDTSGKAYQFQIFDLLIDNIPESTNVAVKILTPNGGEVWRPGSTYRIEWSFTGNDLVSSENSQLDLWDFSTNLRVAIIAKPLTNPGNNYFDWLVPETIPEGTNYRVGLQLEKLMQVPGGWNYPKDYSDQNFTISSTLPTPTITPSPSLTPTPTSTPSPTPTDTPTPSPSPSPTPPDTTAPIVSITNPLNGEKVSGAIDVLANATDNGGIVTKVEFLIDNVLKITDTTSPYGFSFDTETVLNGIHSIGAKGYDQEGNIGSDTISVTVENGDKIPPSAPTGLLGNAESYNKVNLVWNASTDNVGVAGYWIIRDGVTIASSSITNYSDLAVQALTSYTYQVVAYDAASNNSLLSNSVIVTTPEAPDTTPPSPPSNLSARAVSSTQINLSWTASTDNVGVAGYDIYRNNVKVANINSTSYGDTGLTPSTAYNYYVIALDISGNQSVNSNYAGTTTFPPPNATGNITGTVSNQSGAPIAGAKVTGIVNGSKRTYTTNTQGVYFIGNLTPGLTYAFTFSASSYTSQKIYITTIAEQTVVRDVILVKSSGKK